MREPTELEMAIMDRQQMGVVGFGPLTADEADAVARYEAYCEEREAEYQAQLAAGGRTVCPQCGQRKVKSRTVCTLGYPGHPGADYSAYAECGNCDYKDLA